LARTVARDLVRDNSASRTPSRANACAMASPIPRLAPVTMAVLPFIDNDISLTADYADDADCAESAPSLVIRAICVIRGSFPLRSFL